MRTRNLINEFLMPKRFAMAGVSRAPGDFSRKLFADFTRRGYDVVPVNPNAAEIEGRQCFRSLRDVQPPVTSALLMTSKSATTEVLRDCADAGVTLVWLYGVSGSRAVTREAREICEEFGIQVIPGYCPYLFLPEGELIHRLHGFVLKAVRAYPT